MTQADCVYNTPPTNAPVDTTRRFETLKDAEDALMEQGFKLVPNTCNWINADGIDAGVYPVEEAYGVSKYRIEYRALDATPTRRRFLTIAEERAAREAAEAAATPVAAIVPIGRKPAQTHTPPSPEETAYFMGLYDQLDPKGQDLIAHMLRSMVAKSRK